MGLFWAKVIISPHLEKIWGDDYFVWGDDYFLWGDDYFLWGDDYLKKFLTPSTCGNAKFFLPNY
jgi:hypothetical protein